MATSNLSVGGGSTALVAVVVCGAGGGCRSSLFVHRC